MTTPATTPVEPPIAQKIAQQIADELGVRPQQVADGVQLSGSLPTSDAAAG